MSSFKSKIINLLLRNRHLLHGKLNKEVFDFNSSISDFRDRVEKSADRYWKIPKEITIKDQSIEGLKCAWLIPSGADLNKIILYVHGGGYVSGSCKSHRGFVSTFAKNTGVVNLLYEYRLAPEHPFPAAIEDSIIVYQWLLNSGFKSENILVAGESAGGGLGLALMLALKEQNIALPVAAVAISPWLDLTCSSDSYRTKNKVSLAPLNSWNVFSRYYADDHDVSSPLISPLFGNLEGLPPIFINAGVDDELFEDGENFYEKAKAAGIDVTYRAGAGMVHCYPLFSPMFKEATEGMNEIVMFIKRHMNC